MRILIAEDDFASRKFMLKFLSKFGECDVTVDGMEAVDAYLMALEAEAPYDLVCLDIMMPNLDGYQALKAIRDIEEDRKLPEEQQAKIIMTTALNEGANVNKAFDLGCVAYAGKPIEQSKFENVLRKLGLIS
ncbi:MAG: response regulator [Lachnospiraceae bacterium]|jgi:two-component system chemotaxis response regulator CheY|nr:response regulator [Lachnospiraceae bacterium]